MQDQVIGKIKWCVGEMGLNEKEEDSIEKYMLIYCTILLQNQHIT